MTYGEYCKSINREPVGCPKDTRIAELEAALHEVKVQSNTYAKRLVLLGYDDVQWYTTPFPSAKDALAKETT